MKKKLIITFVVLIVIGLGVSFWAIKAKQATEEREKATEEREKANAVLKDAHRECGYFGDLGDKNMTLVLTAKFNDETAKAVCILEALDTPSSVRSKMASTRSIDGRQTDAWDRLEASWIYHPDSGIKIIFELEPVE